MKELAILEDKSGYVMYKGRLEEVTFYRTLFTLTEDENGKKMYRAQHHVHFADGTPYLAEECEIYKNPKEYEAGDCAHYNHIGFDAVMRRLIVGHSAYTDGNHIGFWTFEDGEPRKHDVEVEHLVFYHDTNTFCFDEDKQKVWPDTETYKNRELAISFNSYDVEHTDGTTETRVGKNSLVTLDPDQAELLTQWCKIAHELKNRGVQIVSTYDDNMLLAFNTRKVERFRFCYDDCPSDDEPIDFEHPCFEVRDMPTIERYGEDERPYIKRR